MLARPVFCWPIASVPQAKSLGLTLMQQKLMAARDEASARGLGNLEFRKASLLEPWPARDADFVLIRFVLTHVTNPELVLAHARAALASGGVIAVQDIDYRGRFCDPPSAAHDRYCELYIAAAQRAGGDPLLVRGSDGCSRGRASSTSKWRWPSRSAGRPTSRPRHRLRSRALPTGWSPSGSQIGRNWLGLPSISRPMSRGRKPRWAPLGFRGVGPALAGLLRAQAKMMRKRLRFAAIALSPPQIGVPAAYPFARPEHSRA